MKKTLTLLFIFFNISFLFSQNRYYDLSGYFCYDFSEDFSEFTLSNIEDNDTSSSKIINFTKSSIPFCRIGDIDYVKINADFFFYLINDENQYVFIESEKYNDFHFLDREKLGIYEASSESRIFGAKCHAFNLMYISLEPWISDSENGGIGEYITFESESEFNKFRIINGFVDINNPEYFNQFNKVKKLCVYDKDENLLGEYEIKANSDIQTFELPKKVSYVTIEITDVYEGTNFDDVAITSLQFYLGSTIFEESKQR